MTENGNQKRPVRTLEVENFSVIKKARLEFGRITVLIGPQASGKSLLCKLAYFLGGEVIEVAVESLMKELLGGVSEDRWERIQFKILDSWMAEEELQGFFFFAEILRNSPWRRRPGEPGDRIRVR